MAFCVPYKVCGVRGVSSSTTAGKVAAVDRDRAGEDEARLMRRGAVDLEQRARAVQVHAHAEIEVRFRLTADHRREMKIGRRLAFGGALEQLPVADVAGDLRDTRVAQSFSRDDVDKRDPASVRLLLGEVTALQQPGCQGLAEEAGTAGNEDAHGR